MTGVGCWADSQQHPVRQMALHPDWGKLIWQEQNVHVRGPLDLSRAYDLMLYPELGKSSRAVLVVRVIAAMTYNDGKDASGAALSWTATDKTQYAADITKAINDVWAEKHRITTTSAHAAFPDVGVIFDLKFIEGLSMFSHSHRNITVTKTATFHRSGTSDWWLELGRNNTAEWWSNGAQPFQKGASLPQRPCVHEFGHILGYRDEYPTKDGNPNWLKDVDSVMHDGEQVRERHYALFADWLTQTHAIVSPDIEFRVNGVTTVLTAKL
jgi:hypothetical protein